MTKLSGIIFFLLVTAPVQEISTSRIRTLYKLAAEQREAAEKMLVLLEPYGRDAPLYLGYKAAAHMMMAKHVGNPFSKMSHFNKGKEMFSSAIESDKDNIELRFLRFSVQSEAPGFLGYNDELEEDKKMILKGLGTLDEDELKKMIVNYLLVSKNVTANEKDLLRQ